MIDTQVRARGIALRTLDFTGLLERVPEMAAALGQPLEEGAEVRVGFEPYAAYEKAGRLFVICNEGVGWEVSDELPLSIGLYVSAPGHIAILPKFTHTMTPDAVRAAMTDEEVDLADLVRTFGARLEGNFWEWRRTLGSLR